MSVVHTLWVQGAPSLLIQRCLEAMPTCGLPVLVYSYAPATMPNFPGITVVDAREILPATEIFTYQLGAGKGSYAAFANLFRYVTLAARGGWWLDADVYCIRPFKFNTDYVFTYETDNRFTALHNGIMRTPASAPIMKDMIARARVIPVKHMQWGQTGSKLLTQLVHVNYPGLKQHITHSATFCPIPWQQITTMLDNPPRSIPDCTVAVHLFHERWRRLQLAENSQYKIYEWLEALKAGQ